MRGFKRDREATDAAYALGTLTDKRKRSFISLPKDIPGEGEVPHLVLYGEDKGPIRIAIFAANRRKNRGQTRCSLCGRPVSEEKDGMFPDGEWHHLRQKAGQRCDCELNGCVVCRICHKSQHLMAHFTRRA